MKIYIKLLCVLYMFFVISCTRPDNKQGNTVLSADMTVNSVPTRLAIIPESKIMLGHSSMAEMPSAIKKDVPSETVIFVSKLGKGAAYIEQVDLKYRVVHNGQPGKIYDEIESSNLVVSPDGKRVGYSAKNLDKWYIVVDENEVAISNESGSVVFSDNSLHVAYEQKVVNQWYMVIDGKKNKGARGYFDKGLFVNNSSNLIYLESTAAEGANSYNLVITDISMSHNETLPIVMPDNFTVNSTKSAFAAIENFNGKRRVMLYDFLKKDRLQVGSVYDEIQKPAVSDDGKSVSYVAKRDGDYFLVLNDKEEKIENGTYPFMPLINPSGKGVSIAVFLANSAYIYKGFPHDKSKQIYSECGDIVYSPNGEHRAYIAIKNDKLILVIDGKETPSFQRIVNPKFSPDGNYIVFLARNDDKRFVVVTDLNGSIVRQSSPYERVFDTVFTADGKSVAYGAKDGKELWWKVEKL